MNLYPRLVETIKTLEKSQDDKTDHELSNLIVPLIERVVVKLVASENENRKKYDQEPTKYFTDEEMRLIALILTFEYQPRGSNIITAGDYGDKLFIIIQGEARVLVPNNKTIDKESDERSAPKEDYEIRKNNLNSYFMKLRKHTLLCQRKVHRMQLDKRKSQNELKKKMLRNGNTLQVDNRKNENNDLSQNKPNEDPPSDDLGTENDQ